MSADDPTRRPARRPSKSDPQWYVALTNNRQEVLARSSLMFEGFDCYLPQVLVSNGKGELYGRPMFPGYIFVQFSLATSEWTRLFSMRGLKSVYTGGRGKPMPVPWPIITALRNQELDGYVSMRLANEASQRDFQPGQRVRVNKGPSVDPIDAIFVEPLDKRRCWVLIRLLGDKRLAAVDRAHLE